MPEPFKDRINARSVRRLAADLARTLRSFQADDFVTSACEGLDVLELKGRVDHVADQLRANLPTDWGDAVEALIAASGEPLPNAQRVAGRMELWPVLTVVERHGLHDPERSLAALRSLTRRFSAEFAIRPYLLHHPERTWTALQAWTTDPCLHVRRLCSEGSRPRLPWASSLRASIEDPGRGLRLIERLKDDREPYVRRSVANHLNDVCKDHPERALKVAEGWLKEAPSVRRRLVRHGVRTLLKAGEPRALALFGFDPPEVAVSGARADPALLRIGASTTLRLAVRSCAAIDQPLRIDWIVHGPGLRRRTRRVVRGPGGTLEPGELWSIEYRLPMAPTTTRAVRPGEHVIEVQINGVILSEIRLTMLPTLEA
ncbi:MAG: DNA alkylation repair protein [Deltaproteobacteria bacterium]|nr:MAG: DNA alkylation repair protein [Deltaproteobacteria bacterium]